jgi:hypothetical protein
MSRLRRLLLSDRFFFITCRVHALRRALNESEFACLEEVIAEQGSEEFVHFQTLRPAGSALTGHLTGPMIS